MTVISSAQTLDEVEVGDLAAHRVTLDLTSDRQHLLATLDVEGLQALEEQAGVFVVGATVNDADVGRLQRRVQSHLREVQQSDQTARWKDQGYWLVAPVALLGLLWFRRGWTIRWSAVALVTLVLIPVAYTTSAMWMVRAPAQEALVTAGETREDIDASVDHFRREYYKFATRVPHRAPPGTTKEP